MALGIASQIIGSHIDDRSLVNVADGDVSRGDEVSEPLSGIRIILIVVCTLAF